MVDSDIERYRALLNSTKATATKAKRAKCKRCGEKPLQGEKYCQECKDEVAEEKETARLAREGRSDKGYVYAYDAKGKYRIKARILMEEFLGRPLSDHEMVGYRNGDREDVTLENLYLGYKAGTPIDHIQCANCGQRMMQVMNPEQEEKLNVESSN